MSGLIRVWVIFVVQLETRAERPSHAWRWRLGEGDALQGSCGGGDLRGDCRVVGDELRRSFLDARGVNLRLRLGCHAASRRSYRKIFAHKISGAVGFLDRIQHTALGGVQGLSPSARDRRGFVECVGQPSYLDQVGEGSFLCRFGGETFPHGPARRHGRSMDRSE
jgi:hypothetical protein